jgi:hypothetical protein
MACSSVLRWGVSAARRRPAAESLSGLHQLADAVGQMVILGGVDAYGSFDHVPHGPRDVSRLEGDGSS